MKKARFLLFVVAVASLMLSACGAAATPIVGGGNVQAIPVAFIGIVESMAGDQWVINGNTVTVDPDVINDRSFNVGDQVKVEGVVNSDGSFTVSSVELATPEDIVTLPQFGDDNSNDANVNDGNTNDGNINDDNGNEINSNDDNSNDVNSNNANNNDNDNETNSNDDNSNSANSNDGNTNDDNSNNANSNEDNNNDENSNDDNNDNNSNDANNNDGGNDNGGND